MYLGLPVRPLIFLKKQKISLEELYGYASSDEESVADDEVPPAVEADDHDSDVVHDSDANSGEQIDERNPLCVEVTSENASQSTSAGYYM